MTDLVQQRDPDFLANHVVTAHGRPVLLMPGVPTAGDLKHADPEEVNGLRDVRKIFDAALREHETAVQATDLLGFALQLPEDVIDHQWYFLKQLMQTDWEVREDRFKQLVETAAVCGVHGVIGYRPE